MILVDLVVAALVVVVLGVAGDIRRLKNVSRKDAKNAKKKIFFIKLCALCPPAGGRDIF